MNPQSSRPCPNAKAGDPACHVFVTLAGGEGMRCVTYNGVFPLAKVAWERMIPLVDSVVRGLRVVRSNVGGMELRTAEHTEHMREVLTMTRDAWVDLCGVLLQCAEQGTMDDAIQVAAVLGVVRAARVAADEAARNPLSSASADVALRVADEVLLIMRETHGRTMILGAAPAPPPPETHKRENLN